MGLDILHSLFIPRNRFLSGNDRVKNSSKCFSSLSTNILTLQSVVVYQSPVSNEIKFFFNLLLQFRSHVAVCRKSLICLMKLSSFSTITHFGHVTLYFSLAL